MTSMLGSGRSRWAALRGAGAARCQPASACHCQCWLARSCSPLWRPLRGFPARRCSISCRLISSHLISPELPVFFTAAHAQGPARVLPCLLRLLLALLPLLLRLPPPPVPLTLRCLCHIPRSMRSSAGCCHNEGWRRGAGGRKQRGSCNDRSCGLHRHCRRCGRVYVCVHVHVHVCVCVCVHACVYVCVGASVVCACTGSQVWRCLKSSSGAHGAVCVCSGQCVSARGSVCLLGAVCVCTGQCVLAWGCVCRLGAVCVCTGQCVSARGRCVGSTLRSGCKWRLTSMSLILCAMDDMDTIE